MKINYPHLPNEQMLSDCHHSVSVDVPFQEYVDILLRPQSADALGSGETNVLFDLMSEERRCPGFGCEAL